MNARSIVFATMTALGACALGCAVQEDDASRSAESTGELAPRGEHRIFTPGGDAHVRGGGGGTNGISYHGGPLILGTIDVYFVWYGNWSANSATTILPDLAQNLGGSPYFGVNTTYTDGSGRAVSNSVAYKGSTTDAYSQGSSLSDSAVLAVVDRALSSGKLPYDTNGVYFVLGSSDVNETSGFCTKYCGWHTHGTTSSGANVRYSFVGNPDRCPSACEAQTTGPNGNAGADGMASILSHELEEATTDPDANAWFDSRGQENADKCAWTFGTTYVTSNGAKANMKLGTRDYLIQQNWVNASGGFCALHL